MKKLSVAIVGTGNIAGGYDERKLATSEGVYSHAGAYLANGNYELKSVYDINAQRANEFCATWKVALSLESLSELYSMKHDVISICTPDNTHFEIVQRILLSKCCSTIFVEKPLALEMTEVEEIIDLASKANINVVVNFQRRNELIHCELRDLIADTSNALLSVNGHYMKGLRHIGITMIDTLVFLCGYPTSVLAYNRSYNNEVAEYSYEFILYYAGFTINVKTIDSELFEYNYHIFEIDLLFTNKRKTLVDISQSVRETLVTPYAYSGVKVMNDREATLRDTGYKFCMQDAVAYIYDVTIQAKEHVVNTPQSFYNNILIINKVIESFDSGLVKLNFEPILWKR